jgi:hypothetical protein
MTKLAWTPRHKLVKIGPDLKSGELSLNIFAADLYDVAMGKAKPVYQDPRDNPHRSLFAPLLGAEAALENSPDAGAVFFEFAKQALRRARSLVTHPPRKRGQFGGRGTAHAGQSLSIRKRFSRRERRR